MDYQQAVSYIHSLLKFGIKPGLERMNALLDALGHPEQSLRFVHVAGTNGKGSTCNMLSNVLIDAGYRTGLFTSPYVVDFCERIQLNGVMIPHNALCEEVLRIQPVLDYLNRQGIQPTEFEVITAIALCYFATVKCDIVVLEVGLGGRLDSTNVIPPPLVSIITSVSYDHMAVLGNTLEEIAAEKCGIIKQGGYTVSYPLQQQAVAQIIHDTCTDRTNQLIIPDINALEAQKETITGTDFSYTGVPYHIPLSGRHQLYNAITVIESIKVLQKQSMHISSDNIKSGLAETVIPARMEILEKSPLILLDGGHNADCARALAALLKTHLPGKSLIALIGMMEDKEYDKYLSVTAPLFSKIICAAPDNPRALSPDEAAVAAGKYCTVVQACRTVQSAVTHALAALEQADALVVCGSFYLASEVRQIIKNNI